MKLDKFIKAIESLIKHGHQAHEDALNFEDQDMDLLKTAEKLIDARHEDQPYRMEFKDKLLQKVLKQSRAKQGKKALAGFWDTIKPVFNLKALSTVGVVALVAILLINILGRGPGGEPLIDIINPGNIGGILVPVAHAQDNFELEAEELDEFGVISPGTSFVLTSKTEIKIKDLEKHLSLGDNNDFELEVVEKGYSYRIDPAKELKAGAVLQVSIATVTDNDGVLQPYNFSWVFEVADHFKVYGSVPRNQTAGVSTNTAIRFDLSHSNTVIPDDFINVTPDHPVRIEQKFKSLVVIPTKPWDTDELYTITIKKGFGVDSSLLSDDEDLSLWQLQKNFSVAFTTETTDPELTEYMYFWNPNLQTLPGQSPELRGSTNGISENSKVNIEVFSVSDDEGETMMGAKHKLDDWMPSSLRQKRIDNIFSSLQQATPVQSYELDDEAGYGINLSLQPINIEGIYVVKLSIGEVYEYLMWGVSNLGAHIVVSETQALIWTVDVEASRPISGAAISTLDQNLGVSGADGVLSFNEGQIAQLQEKEVFIVEKDGKKTMVPVWNWKGEIQSHPVFQGFFYADQNLVHQDDTVRFWGLVREKNGAIPTDITIEISSWDYSRDYSIKEVSQIANIKVDGQGFFRGEMELHNLREGFYSLNALLGDEIFRSISLNVKQFVTPEIQIEVTPEKNRVDAGDSNFLTIKTTFFDGKKAPFIDLNLSGETDQRVTTNKEGVVVVEVPSDLYCSNCYDYQGKYVDVTPAQATSGETKATVTWAVTYKYLETSYNFVATPLGVKVIGSVTQREYINDNRYITPADWIEKPAKNTKYYVRVNKVTSTRSELLSYYDNYTNKLRYYYDYKTEGAHVDTLEGMVDENGEFFIEFEPEQNYNYSFKVSVDDEFGHTDGSDYSLDLFNIPFGRHYVTSEEEIVEITKKEETAVARTIREFLELRVSGEEDPKLGETVELEAIFRNKLGSELPKDSYTMFFVASPNIQDYSVQQNTTFKLTLEDKHIPQARVGAVTLYKGSMYPMWYTYTISIDNEDFALNVDVKTEKDAYSIRDKVNATVSVSDQNGDPVEATVNIKVLDKAYVELDPYSVLQNPIDQLWKWEWERIYINQSSHVTEIGGDGKGGGGGDFRQTFQEEPFYDVVRTDENGQASITFSLPDNLTTFEIVASAATDQMQGGVGNAEIVVSQDLRVMVNHGTSFLVGDEAVISAQVFGDLLTKDDSIDLSFYSPIQSIEGHEYSIGDFPVASEVRQVVLADQTTFTLPQLEPGDYVFGLRASVNGAEDVILKQFEIIPGRATTQNVQSEAVTEGWQPPSLESVGRVRVSVGSEIGAQAYQALYRICECSGRLDHLLATRYAKDLLNQYFGADAFYEDSDRVIDNEYKVPGGGYALFPFGDANSELSAEIMAMVDKEGIAVGEAVLYFESYFRNEESTPEELSHAFLGLAALEQPGLNLLRTFSSREDLNLSTRLNVIDALLLYGDKKLALQLWQEVVNDHFQEEEGVAWLSSDDALEQDEKFIQLWVQKAALITLMLGDANHEKFYRYLQKAVVDPVSPIMKVRYWEERLRLQPVTQMSFVVKMNETEQFISLQGFQSYSLDLEPEQLSDVVLLDVKGNMVATIITEQLGEVEESSEAISVTRTYIQNGILTDIVDPSLPLDVKIVVKASDRKYFGNYLVKDILPSGFEARSRQAWWGYEYKRCYRIPYNVQAHTPQTHIWLSDYCPTITITYKARAVANAGKYRAEGVTVTSSDNPEIKVVTKDQWIEIKK